MASHDDSTALADLLEHLSHVEQSPPGTRTGIRHLVEAADCLAGALRNEIREARRSGLTWAAIGAELGVSRQAAQMRFGGQDETGTLGEFTP